MSASQQTAAGPVFADLIIADLVQQLDGIGIPDWAGAEGLCLDAARKYLTAQAVEDRRAREHARLLAEVSWCEHDFPFELWQIEVADGNTRRSYADWVLAQREQQADEAQ